MSCWVSECIFLAGVVGVNRSQSVFPLIFQSLCAHKILFSYVFGTMCIKHFWKEHLCALEVFLCLLISRLVCVRAHAQLRGNIGLSGKFCAGWDFEVRKY